MYFSATLRDDGKTFQMHGASTGPGPVSPLGHGFYTAPVRISRTYRVSGGESSGTNSHGPIFLRCMNGVHRADRLWSVPSSSPQRVAAQGFPLLCGADTTRALSPVRIVRTKTESLRNRVPMTACLLTGVGCVGPGSLFTHHTTTTSTWKEVAPEARGKSPGHSADGRFRRLQTVGDSLAHSHAGRGAPGGSPERRRSVFPPG